ncbi:Uncharacterised protein [Mycobacterium tuberculosis]|uniref:Uncharacterized protein n=1 Tax=Mycobacterium tuberculosis TaxID=1773 RepID=A0A0T9EPN1_MYCTX|nr:Uncharacterised protein [Mycobacterium tuberculosis]CKR93930.1 Uncharacterised protein [Mycobacterium tuberculosis]CKS20853.1 Uncharacterised protein [Mycobacterium tuberculosis]CKS65399.1 Uncharacterised protein [Mycobacterium tuberculosis]CKT29862.1 Uncharacterised protein [Mycobacterium tuberculosis]
MFSTTEWLANNRSTPIEITAAGMEVANVNPTLSPRYTLAAVNTKVINAPRTTPRMVISRAPTVAPDMAIDPIG